MNIAALIDRARALIGQMKAGKDVGDELLQVVNAIAAEVRPPRPHTPSEPFAIVQDRMYEGEGPSLAIWNGESYEFSDGDCYTREGDYLDDCKAQWLTHYQMELLLTASRPSRSGVQEALHLYQVDPATPQSLGQAAKYRLLTDGDIIQDDDEFILDDAMTWEAYSQSFGGRAFVGKPYSTNGFLQPARRRIKGGGQ